MNRNNGRLSTSDDERGEGARASSEPKDPGLESRGPEFRPNRAGPLAGETGIFSLAQIQAESAQMNERQDASRTPAETVGVPAPVARRHAPLVLIVEDSVDLADLIQATLSRHNLQVVAETHGHSALDRYLELKPDLVLLDIGLPDMTGWRLLDSIKESQQKTGHRSLIIVMTAYGDAGNRLVGKLQNVHSYLVKPFTTSEVERAVMTALGNRV